MRTFVFPVGCILISAFAFLAASSSPLSLRAQSPADASSANGSAGQTPDSTPNGSTSRKKTAGNSSAAKSSAEKPPAPKVPAAKARESGKPGIPKILPGITPEREAAVMTFVQRHHPALAELLIHLKENAPKEYDRAVRDLLRTSERLAQIQERDSLTYELELQSWKARSRAQLLAARLQMGESVELREQLRAALNEEYDLRLQLLERDRERAAERLKNLGDQIERIRQRRAEEIDRQMKQLTSAARGGETNEKAKAKAKAKGNETSPEKKKTRKEKDTSEY